MQRTGVPQPRVPDFIGAMSTAEQLYHGSSPKTWESMMVKEAGRICHHWKFRIDGKQALNLYLGYVGGL